MAQKADQICQTVIKYCQQGWPRKSQLNMEMQQYQEHQAHFIIGDGLLLYNTRKVVPKSLRKETLDKIHRGHQGIERCRARARMAVWWPGLSKEIVELVKSCRECTKRFTLKHESLIPPNYQNTHGRKLGLTYSLLSHHSMSSVNICHSWSSRESGNG